MQRQNDVFYIQEAFKKLQTLHEDSFDLQDVGVVDELQSFVADDIDAPMEEIVIDTQAETVDDLQDSYVGKVILQCNCCNARLYKDEEEVFVDEEQQCANVEEECPLCGNAYGFTVIGKIEPYKEDEFDKEDVDVEVEEDESEFTDDQVREALKESMRRARSKRKLKESNLREDVQNIRNLVSDYLSSKTFELTDNLAWEVAAAIPEYDISWCNEEGWGDVEDKASMAEADYIEALLDILFLNAPKNESLKEDLDIHIETTPEGEVNVEVEKEPEDVVTVEDESQEELVDEGCHKKNESIEIHADQDTEGNVVAKVEVDEFENVEINDKEETTLPPDDIELTEEFNDEHIGVDEVTIDLDTAADDSIKLEDEDEEPVKDLNEDIENLSLDTESTHMEMTSDDNGKVVVTTEPRDNETGDVEDEMIAPLSDEEISDIEMNTSEEEAPIEDEFEVDEFEENSFDELGESFLRRVYENVNSFKTTKASYKKGKLVIEGLIKFSSGKEKKTSFVFENFKKSKKGKVVLSGLNETFSKSKTSFILKGDLKNKKFVSESMIYNYSTKTINESNKSESVRVYGRAILRNKK